MIHDYRKATLTERREFLNKVLQLTAQLTPISLNLDPSESDCWVCQLELKLLEHTPHGNQHLLNHMEDMKLNGSLVQAAWKVQLMDKRATPGMLGVSVTSLQFAIKTYYLKRFNVPPQFWEAYRSR